MLLSVLLTGTNQSAQVKCITCPDSVSASETLLISQVAKSAAKPYRDTLLSRLAKVVAKQDSICSIVDSLKPNELVRSERYTLLSGEWVYEWHYVNGYFSKLVKKRL